MDAEILPAAIVWAALGIALACLVARLKEPERRPEPPQAETPAAETPAVGD